MFCITLPLTMVILYLGSTSARPNNEKFQYNASMPDACHGKDYCFQKHNNYPQENIEKILNKVASHLWRELSSDYVGVQSGGGIPGGNDCSTRISMDPIYEIIDLEGRVRYVVQSAKTFEQILRVEECRNPGRLHSRTVHFTEFDLKHNNLSCEETRLNYNFLVLTTDLEGFEMAKAKNGIPICCTCVYRRT